MNVQWNYCCDNNDDNVEIENSGVTFTVNRKTSKKMKLKNILKAALFRSADVLGGFAKRL